MKTRAVSPVDGETIGRMSAQLEELIRLVQTIDRENATRFSTLVRDVTEHQEAVETAFQTIIHKQDATLDLLQRRALPG